MQKATSDFDFGQLVLSNPTSIQGGAYFTKISAAGKPLYVDTPRSLTKQGFVRSGKKLYCDLMFDSGAHEFIEWIENLEARCQHLIFEKGSTWFETKLDLDDVQTAFVSPIRIFKSGSNYLIRVNAKINNVTGLPYFKVFNESETPMGLDDVTTGTTIVSVVEVQGIRFTSKTFQIELEIKQVMIVHGEEIFNMCLLNKAKGGDCEQPGQNVEVLGARINFDKDHTRIQSLQEDLEQSTLTDDKPMEKMEEFPPKEIRPEEVRPEEIHTKEMEEETNLENTHRSVEELGTLQECDMNWSFSDESDKITLKKPNQVYYDIYKAARKKAKTAKRDAIIAFLEAKNIKKAYMLPDLDDSDSGSDDCEFDESSHGL